MKIHFNTKEKIQSDTIVTNYCTNQPTYILNPNLNKVVFNFLETLLLYYLMYSI